MTLTTQMNHCHNQNHPLQANVDNTLQEKWRQQRDIPMLMDGLISNMVHNAAQASLCTSSDLTASPWARVIVCSLFFKLPHVWQQKCLSSSTTYMSQLHSSLFSSPHSPFFSFFSNLYLAALMSSNNTWLGTPYWIQPKKNLFNSYIMLYNI